MVLTDIKIFFQSTKFLYHLCKLSIQNWQQQQTNSLLDGWDRFTANQNNTNYLKIFKQNKYQHKLQYKHYIFRKKKK